MSYKMYLLLQFLVVISLFYNLKVASVKHEVSGELVKGSDTEAEKDLQCGGVHEVFDELSVLSYKITQPLESIENCIWTLNASNRSLIKINVTDTYYRYRGQSLSVGYFNKSNYDQLDFFTRIKLPMIYESHAIEVPGPVAFLHFMSERDDTNPDATFGFRLNFEASGEKQSTIYNFENYFLEGQHGKFRYPPNGGTYKNNMRVTIVVKTNGIPENPSKIHIVIKDIEESPNCLVNSLNVYAVVPETWNKTSSLCGHAKGIYEYFFRYPRNDPMILTFMTDDSGVGNGFDLLWLNDLY